jgi:hypothetical protein
MNNVPNGYTEVLRTDNIKEAITYTYSMKNINDYILVCPNGDLLYPDKMNTISVNFFFKEGEWGVGKKCNYKTSDRMCLVQAILFYKDLINANNKNVKIVIGESKCFTDIVNINKNIIDGVYSYMELRSSNWVVRWE